VRKEEEYMIIKKADRLTDVKAYYFATKLQEVAMMNADGGIPIINLGIGSPDLLPPKSVIETLQDAANDPLANKYQSYKGLPQLRSAVSNWYAKWFDIKIDPNTEVLPLIGSKEGIMHISMSFLQEGDIALVPNPGYPAYKTCTELTGAKALPYELSQSSDWLPDLKNIAKETNLSKVKIMWINYPHMPTGAKASSAFYHELIPWAKKHKILICSDSPYSFILNDSIVSPLQTAAAKEVCIELISLSKCYNMAGWRVGAIVGNESYINTVMTFKSNMDSGMYRPIQEAAIEAMSQEQDWFDGINAIYKERKEIALKIMDVLDLDYDAESAGMFVWGKMAHNLHTSAQVINDILQGARVFLTPGHIFGSAGEGYIRLSLCNTVENLQEALSRIQNHLKHFA